MNTTMNVRSAAWLLLLLCFPMDLRAAEASLPTRPNVVLFLVDDMGWMDSSPYGSQYYETPHMQRLAQQSMRFTDAYAVPLCSPTRASILTGQYSSRHRITSASGHQPPVAPNASPYPSEAPPGRPLIYAESKNYLNPDLATIGKVLHAAGYRTGHFGKWHLGLMPEHRPDRYGFEWTWHCAPDPGPPSYFSPYGVVPEGRSREETGTGTSRTTEMPASSRDPLGASAVSSRPARPTGRQKVGNITDGPDGEYITDRLTDEALKFIDAHRGEPFYLNLWQYGVHGPWGHKESYTAEFAKKTDPRGKQRNPIMASMLKSVDESLGRVLDKLDELGLTDNTLFIFYSDNGGNTHSNIPGTAKTDRAEQTGNPMLLDWRKWAGAEPPTNNAPLREGKGRIYEGGTRVPLMVRWPGRIQPGSISDAVVGPIDLYPTILDATGLANPTGHRVDGLSLLPVLEQTGTLARNAYFIWFPHLIPGASVRVGDWKLIRRFETHPDYPDLLELYNLKDDLGETANLADQMPDKVKQLDALIDDFIRDTGALVPKPNPAYSPRPAAPPKASADPAAGLVPKMCKISLVAGALRVEPDGRAPFLGTAQVKHTGPMSLTMRARSTVGGEGKVQWKTADQEDFPASGQIVAYTLPPGGQWQEVSIDLPVEGTSAIVRLYLPAAEAPVEIESLRYSAPERPQPIRVWDFRAVKPADDARRIKADAAEVHAFESS
jgi:arylsulfatase A-like enzyme